MSSAPQDQVKTRICILSDTHSSTPFPSDLKHRAYRYPLPKADVLIHAGDLTFRGELAEHEKMAEALRGADAELKIVIGGNHDISLDSVYISNLPSFKGADPRSYLRRYNVYTKEEMATIKDLYCGDEALQHGIRYVEEGVQTFTLRNGAKFTVYSSPWTPEHGLLAWTYPEGVDRYNPSSPSSRFQASTPVPSFPEIDIMITHGPPHGILDYSLRGNVNAGCPHLMRAVERCRPRIHCFGHIHEGWGAERVDWIREMKTSIQVNERKKVSQRSAYVDLSPESRAALRFGEETLFVNASIMDTHYEPRNAPWLIDLGLPRDSDCGDEESAETASDRIEPGTAR